MARETLKTLFHPFASGTLEPLPEGARVAFLGAEAGYAVPEGFGAAITAVQGIRPLYRRLEAKGADVHAALPEGTYDAGFLILNKHRGENENRLATLLRVVKTGGLILVAGSREDGIQPMRKLLLQQGVAFEHMPKYHGVVCWFEAPGHAAELAARIQKPAKRVEDRFVTAPGMFSHERVDEGSALLASRLPEDFDGNAADFGAGWGYLSVALAEKAPRTARIDLFEADHAALEAAKTNLANLVPDLQARFFWQDLAQEEPKERYDMVIMNPPFHEGHAAEPGLGQAMIRMAAKALRQGGKLMLVANRGLPYEPVLAELFRESGETCRNARFKVLWAKK